MLRFTNRLIILAYNGNILQIISFVCFKLVVPTSKLVQFVCLIIRTQIKQLPS